MKRGKTGLWKVLTGGPLPVWCLLAELIVLLAVMWPCFFGKTELTFLPAQMELGQAEEGTVQRDDSCTFTAEDKLTVPASLTTERFSLRPGAYRVRAVYDSQVNYDARASFENGLAELTMASGNSGAYVYFDFPALLLRDSLGEMEQTVQILSPLPVEELYLQVQYHGQGSLSVHSLQIEEVPAYKYLKLAGTVGLLLALNSLIWLLRRSDDRKKVVICGLGLIAGLALVPFAVDFSYLGHDYEFHLNRIVSLAAELEGGRWFSPIFFTALNGYGYANPLFYGQAFLYFPAILYLCGFSLSFAYNAYIVAMTLGTIFISYYVFAQIFDQTRPALMATALYTLNPVRFSNVLIRAAIGEFSAQTFLPLTLLGFYRVYTRRDEERIGWEDYLPIILGLTCTLLTHTLSFVMSALLIAAFCLLNWKRTFQKRRFFALFKAAALTFLLNLSTLVPFLDSYRMPLEMHHQENYIQGEGAYLLQVLSPVVNSNMAMSSDHAAGEEMSYALGFALVIGLVAYGALLLLRKQTPRTEKERRLFGFTKVSFGIALAAIVLSTSLLPFNAMDRLPAPVYFLFSIHRLPWRWRVFAALFASVCTAYALENLDKLTDRKNLSGPVALLTAVFLLLNMGQMYEGRISGDHQSRLHNNAYQYSMRIGAWEYLIWGTDKYQMVYAEPSYDTEALAVTAYEREGGATRLYVENRSEAEQEISLPIMCYDNYLVIYEDGTVATPWCGENNRLTLAVPGGYTGEISVEYHMRSLWKLAIGESVALLTAMVGYGILSRRKRRKA